MSYDDQWWLRESGGGTSGGGAGNSGIEIRRIREFTVGPGPDEITFTVLGNLLIVLNTATKGAYPTPPSSYAFTKFDGTALDTYGPFSQLFIGIADFAHIDDSEVYGYVLFVHVPDDYPQRIVRMRPTNSPGGPGNTALIDASNVTSYTWYPHSVREGGNPTETFGPQPGISDEGVWLFFLLTAFAWTVDGFPDGAIDSTNGYEPRWFVAAEYGVDTGPEVIISIGKEPEGDGGDPTTFNPVTGMYVQLFSDPEAGVPRPPIRFPREWLDLFMPSPERLANELEPKDSSAIDVPLEQYLRTEGPWRG